MCLWVWITHWICASRYMFIWDLVASHDNGKLAPSSTNEHVSQVIHIISHGSTKCIAQVSFHFFFLLLHQKFHNRSLHNVLEQWIRFVQHVSSTFLVTFFFPTCLLLHCHLLYRLNRNILWRNNLVNLSFRFTSEHSRRLCLLKISETLR